MAKTFFLTGSGLGLGRALSETILEAGHHLIATALQPEALVDLVKTHGRRILPLPLDVRNADACRTTMRLGIDRFGSVDVVINNAGFASSGSIEDMPLEAMQAIMATNFFGPIHVIRAALPYMRTQGHGHVIQISSIAARTARPAFALYFASKRALTGLSECLAQEVASFGVKVTILEPNMLRTNFFSQTHFPSDSAYSDSVGKMISMTKQPHFVAKLGDPKKIATAILKIIELDSPPLRLLVGNDAYLRGTEADRQRLIEDERWKWLSDETEDQ